MTTADAIYAEYCRTVAQLHAAGQRYAEAQDAAARAQGEVMELQRTRERLWAALETAVEEAAGGVAEPVGAAVGSVVTDGGEMVEHGAPVDYTIMPGDYGG